VEDVGVRVSRSDAAFLKSPPIRCARKSATRNPASPPVCRRVPCAICHTEDLKGASERPQLPGQQPLNIARQLFDMQSGSSTGEAVCADEAGRRQPV
jgi:cytochrome c553